MKKENEKNNKNKTVSSEKAMVKTKKEKSSDKFIEIIKKKWIINGTKTLILVLAIIAAFLGINVLMQNLELTPLDFTQEKLYTLTDESKEKVKNIDKDVNIFFIGYNDEDSNIDLAKQYKNVNEKIVAEAVDIANRPDLSNKYGIENGTQGIIVECGEKAKVLTANDLVTYDMTTYETISIAEEKLTSAIISVTSEKVPKVYFLEGYSEYSLSQNMRYLGIYLDNEITEVETLNVLTAGKIPDDCDTLIITTPIKDFDDIATNAIIDYINSGRNILWFNSAITQKKDIPNVNKVLELYGVKPFEIGIIRETNASKMMPDTPDLIIPEMQYNPITKDLVNSIGVVFVKATKINLDTDRFEELKIEQNDLLLASADAYFRTNFNIQSNSPMEGEEKGTFVVGTELHKTVKEENEETGEKKLESKLIIYGENYFITDYPLSQTMQSGAIGLAYNKDLVLNSIAYLVDREEDIVARKSTGTVTYTATGEQDLIVRIVIFTVPCLIILAGIIIWILRRRKK